MAIMYTIAKLQERMRPTVPTEQTSIAGLVQVAAPVTLEQQGRSSATALQAHSVPPASPVQQTSTGEAELK
jgi:hypothetical protein